MKAAIEQVFDGSLQSTSVGDAYDPNKINIDYYARQFNLGSGETDKFVGPNPINSFNFSQAADGVQDFDICRVTPDLFYIFGANWGLAATTRQIYLTTYNILTNTFVYIGAITVPFPGSSSTTFRGMKAALTNYSTGTISGSGTAITGSGTSFTTQCAGSRIGFGSTDPKNITTWYEIQNISSNVNLTLTSSAGTIAAGTPYVIQDLSLFIAGVGTPASSSGLFVVKGLNQNDFATNSTIASATTIDRIKASYALKDASTATLTTPVNLALGPFVSWSNQDVYITDFSGTILFRFNGRANLSPSSGVTVLSGANISKITLTVTGTVNFQGTGYKQLVYANPKKGYGKDVPALFLLTETALNRIPISSLNSTTASAADFVTINTEYNALLLPALTSGQAFLRSVAYCEITDCFILACFAKGTIYTLEYNPSTEKGYSTTKRAGCQSLHTFSDTRDSGIPVFLRYPYPSDANTPYPPSLVSSEGFLGIVTSTTSISFSAANTQQGLIIYPLAADFNFNLSKIICPKIAVGNRQTKLYRVAVNAVQNIGNNLVGVSPDYYKIHYRTAGIDDNTGKWIEVSQNGDLSSVSTVKEIQFSFTFRTISTMMLPARILSLALIYEVEESIPLNYDWNFSDSNVSTGIVGFTQKSSFSGGVPKHTIYYYNANNNELIFSQDSNTTGNGQFQYWNGTTWLNGLGTNTTGTRRRFVPTTLIRGVSLYTVLSIV